MWLDVTWRERGSYDFLCGAVHLEKEETVGN